MLCSLRERRRLKVVAILFLPEPREREDKREFKKERRRFRRREKSGNKYSFGIEEPVWISFLLQD